MLAAELVSAGAKVTFIYGPGKEPPPNGCKLIRVETSQEMYNAVRKEMKQKFEVVILAAAVSDYTPEKMNTTKIKSDEGVITIKLKQVSKIINEIKKIQKSVFLIGFKAETNLSKEKLIIEARKKLKETKAEMIITNDIGMKKYRENPDYNNVILVDSNKEVQSGWKKKSEIAKFILKHLERII